MTEIEKLELQKETIGKKIDDLKKRQVEDSLRASFAALSDESIPVGAILTQVLSGGRRPVSEGMLSEFAERLATIVKQHSDQ